jgi:hypothetical protein
MNDKFMYLRKSIEKGDRPVITNRGSVAFFFLRPEQSCLLSIHQEMSVSQN